MPRGNHFGVDEKVTIRTLHNAGVSCTAIARLLGRSGRGVRQIVAALRLLPPTVNPPPPKKRTGPRRKLSLEQQQRLQRYVLLHPGTTARQLRQDVSGLADVHVRTVQRAMQRARLMKQDVGGGCLVDVSGLTDVSGLIDDSSLADVSVASAWDKVLYAAPEMSQKRCSDDEKSWWNLSSDDEKSRNLSSDDKKSRRNLSSDDEKSRNICSDNKKSRRNLSSDNKKSRRNPSSDDEKSRNLCSDNKKSRRNLSSDDEKSRNLSSDDQKGRKLSSDDEGRSLSSDLRSAPKKRLARRFFCRREYVT